MLALLAVLAAPPVLAALAVIVELAVIAVIAVAVNCYSRCPVLYFDSDCSCIVPVYMHRSSQIRNPPPCPRYEARSGVQ